MRTEIKQLILWVLLRLHSWKMAELRDNPAVWAQALFFHSLALHLPDEKRQGLQPRWPGPELAVLLIAVLVSPSSVAWN